MKLYVARHGQTNYNTLGLCNSDPSKDVFLTDVGKRQAESLAQKLKGVPIDQIFVSELKRTTQTAEFANTFLNAPMAVDKRLNDNSTGFESGSYEEYIEALNAADNKWTVRLNDGESLEDVKERVQSFLTELKADNYQTVLIVTSMCIVQAMYAVLHNCPNEEAWSLAVDNGSCIEFEL